MLYQIVFTAEARIFLSRLIGGTRQGLPPWRRRSDPAGPEPRYGSRTQGHRRPSGRVEPTDTEELDHPTPGATDHARQRANDFSRRGRSVLPGKLTGHK